MLHPISFWLMLIYPLKAVKCYVYRTKITSTSTILFIFLHHLSVKSDLVLLSFLFSFIGAHLFGAFPKRLWRHLPDLHLHHGETHCREKNAIPIFEYELWEFAFARTPLKMLHFPKKSQHWELLQEITFSLILILLWWHFPLQILDLLN